MIPRTQFVDYRVDENCPYCSNEYYTTEKACIEAGYDWGGVYKSDKCVFTFNRYINGVAEAGEPELGGLGSESIGTIVYDPNVEQPNEEG